MANRINKIETRIYRDGIGIDSEVLEKFSVSTSTTRVMYSAYLSHTQLKERTSRLTELGLLEKNNESFSTTKKGRLFVEIYKEIARLYFPETNANTAAVKSLLNTKISAPAAEDIEEPQSGRKYRAQLEIDGQILDNLSIKKTRTQAMYNNYLSFAQLRKLDELVDSGLLNKSGEGAKKFYEVTAKGSAFFQLYSKLMVLYNPKSELIEAKRG